MESRFTTVTDDGLPIPEVGAWAEAKYRLVSLYDKLFSTGMKNRWNERIYIDLYAGAGYNRIRGTDRIILGSPILALQVPDPFDKYIFCETAPENIRALEQRAKRISGQIPLAFIPGDCNENVATICSEIPKASKGHTVLSLCFIDPFDLGLQFRTITKLSDRYIDFLVLLALHMDANRAASYYISGESRKVDEMLGDAEWRPRWREAELQAITFPKFLASAFSSRMETLGYIGQPFYSMRAIRSDEKNLPLYHLALFSRSSTAYDFWQQVLKYSDDQLGFSF